MSNITKLLTSRTFLTGIVMWVVTFMPVVSQIVPAQWKPLIDAILTLLMFYFHVNPSTTYNLPADGSSVRA